MKFARAVLTIVLLTAAALSQEKPTVEQCRADLNAWKSTSVTERDALDVRELQRRMSEMTSCSDIENKDRVRKEMYFDAAVLYDNAVSARYFKFLVRHKLLQQFLDEDAAGQR